MPWRETMYSHLVAWLKILLPLAGLALLSTLFLFSQNSEQNETIPVAEFDLEQRAREQRVSAPYFAGATENGDLVSFTADSARPDPASRDRALAENLAARIELISGTVLQFSAESGIVNDPADLVNLQGKVVITSSTGYRIIADDLSTGLRRIYAETDGAVTGTGPPGRFTAGKMTLTSDPDTGGAQLVFTNRVKLIYDPAATDEE